MALEGSGGKNFKSAQNNGAASTVNVTMAAVAGRTNYLKGLMISGLGATAAAAVACSVTGLSGGTMTFRIDVPAGATVPIQPIEMTFDEGWPASAPNTAIVLQIATFGAGNTEASGTIWGYDM